MSQRTLLKREVREVKVKLDTEGVARFGVQLAEDLDKREAVEKECTAEVKTIKDEAAATVSQLTENINSARRAITTRSRPEQVEVEDWADHVSGIVSTVRVDTSEIVGTRNMTAEERQVPIDYVGPPPAKET